MPLFICRWTNGDFSAVSAPTESDARAKLDEIGDRDEPIVFICSDFVVHFRLSTAVKLADCLDSRLPPLKFEGFGDETAEFLEETIYPHYCVAATEVFNKEISVDVLLSGPPEELRRRASEWDGEGTKKLNAALQIEKGDRVAAQEAAVESFIPEVAEALSDLTRAFREKFGRDPGPGDPILFDPDADTPQPLSPQKISSIWDGVINALAAVGVPPELVYASRKTGMVISPMNLPFISPADLAAWERAIEEYHNTTTVQ